MKFPVLFRLLLSLFVLTSTAHAKEDIAEILNDRSLKMSRASDRAQMVTQIRAIENQRLAAAKQKARRMGLPIRIEGPRGNIADLVGFFGDEPHYITTLNANAAISTGANLLQAAPYGLDGAGLIVGIWDSTGGNATHQEFALPDGSSRLTNMETSFAGNHSSHIAGTIGAAGVDPLARGMAPAAQINSYTRSNDLSEMTSRAATGPDQQATHIYLSNHSYGSYLGWQGTTWFGDGTDTNAAEYRFGRYESTARNMDALAYNAPYYLIFWAAGNERENNPKPGDTVKLSPTESDIVAYDPALHPPGDGLYRNGYETIAADGIAKNLVTVGAVNDAVSSGVRDTSLADLADFSSTGPTDDGRIKPDLVANGVGLYSTSEVSATSYSSQSGTSMASPNACGSAALLIQHYSQLFSGGAMRASTLKGLLIHTADDLGNPGPDYFYGWGLVKVRKAADHLLYHSTFPNRQRLSEEELSSTTPERTHSFEWDGVAPLRATLSWTDPAGEASAMDVHDSRTPILVNDLNLKLIAPDGSEYFPYVMPFVGTWTTESMALPATTGVNHTDNVEQVRIENSAQSGTWQAEVSYAGSLADDLQAYSLLVSTDDDFLSIDTTAPNPDPISWKRVPEAGGGPILDVVAGTDFTGRTISGATASNIPWTTNGVSSPGTLKTTANFNLYDTTDAQGHFAPQRNMTAGPWSVEVQLNLTVSEISLTEVVIDYQHFNNNGNYQTGERWVDWTVSVSGSSSGELGSVLVEGASNTSGVETAVFDPPLLLSSGQSYTLTLTAAGEPGNNTGLDALTINGQFGIAGDPETEITMTASTATDQAGVEYYFEETSGKVGGDDSGWQDSPTYTDSGLIPGTTYTYTVTARDKSPFHNRTAASAVAPATTSGEPPAFYAWSDGQSFEADSNADGVVNGIAWFLGASDPQSAANMRLPTVDNNSDPDYFIFSYQRDAAALAAGAQATVDYSSDLENWLPAVHDGSDIIIDDSEDPVQVRMRRTLAEEGRLFLRLNVQRN